MITVYHDSFKVTAPNKVRIHAGMLLEEPSKMKAEVFLEILPKGKYIVSRQEITLPEFETAWNALFLWMNENGHQFRKECPYEIYHNDYQEHPEKKVFGRFLHSYFVIFYDSVSIFYGSVKLISFRK